MQLNKYDSSMVLLIDYSKIVDEMAAWPHY